jgi:hypothetical protein
MYGWGRTGADGLPKRKEPALYFEEVKSGVFTNGC